MKRVLRIGNAQAFWGDRNSAACELLEMAPSLDVLTMDYLAELSMSILALQREKDREAGYAKDFVEVIGSLAHHFTAKKRLVVISNAGGLNPLGCGLACQKLLRLLSCPPLRIAVVAGDDILDLLKSSSLDDFPNSDSGEPIEKVRGKLATANAYLGAKPIVDALRKGADIVITGRIADPSLTVAPCLSYFDWSPDDYDKIASATIAGHLIECGTQVTGGFSTNWEKIESMVHPGYPIVEMEEEGAFTITKAENSGGAVTIETVKEQLLYEIGDPDNYLSPDVTASFLSLALEVVGKDAIRITGAKGRAPPKDLKVSATYRDGYRIESCITLFGRECRRKGKKVGEIVKKRLEALGKLPSEFLVECIGTGDVVPGIGGWESLEGTLRFAARDEEAGPLLQLAKEIAPLVTSGPQGITGYGAARAKPRAHYAFWPTLIAADKVSSEITFLEV